MRKIKNRLASLQKAASVIKYVSTWPGVGKTNWCIRYLLNKLTKREGITLYVAPTTILLKEIRDALHEKWPSGENIHYVVTDNDNPLSVNMRIDALINGSNFDGVGGTVKPCKQGTVLLITHEGFRNISHSVDKPFNRRGEVTVIFDEARKCLVKQCKLAIPDPIFIELMSNYLLLHGTGTYKKLALKKSVNTAEFDALFSASKALRKLRVSLLQHIFQPIGAVQVYAKWSKKDLGLAQVTELHTVLVPHQMFSHWKSVLLLGAFLEESQMFGLLRNQDVSDQRVNETGADYLHRVNHIINSTSFPHVIMEDITHKVVKEERIEAIRKRFKATTICYLSEHTSLSQELIKKGLMVDPKVTDPANSEYAYSFSRRYAELLFKVPVKKGVPRIVFRRAATLSKDKLNPVTINLKNHVHTLPGLEIIHPIAWYAMKAVEASDAWYALHNKLPQVLPMSLNIGTQSSGLGHKHPKSYWNLIVSKIEKIQRRCTPIPFQAHGLNVYQKLDTIAYLASVNPKPEAKRLLESICYQYDADKDHTLESCIQAVTRSSIRNTKSTNKPLLIVTDKKLALQVQEQLGYLPKVISAAELGVDVKDPFKPIGMPPAEMMRIRREDPKYLQQVASRAYTNNNKLKLDAYVKANSKLQKKVASQKSWVSQLKKAGDRRYDTERAKLQDLLVQFKAEKKQLIENFKLAE